MDADGDGYVSYHDYEKALDKLQIQAARRDISASLQLLDPEGKGFLDFRAFSKKIGPNMTDQLTRDPRSQSEIKLPNLVPNREKLRDVSHRGSSLMASVHEARKTF